jgi:hypothetical protein
VHPQTSAPASQAPAPAVHAVADAGQQQQHISQWWACVCMALRGIFWVYQEFRHQHLQCTQ